MLASADSSAYMASVKVCPEARSIKQASLKCTRHSCRRSPPTPTVCAALFISLPVIGRPYGQNWRAHLNWPAELLLGRAQLSLMLTTFTSVTRRRGALIRRPRMRLATAEAGELVHAVAVVGITHRLDEVHDQLVEPLSLSPAVGPI